MIRYFSFSHLCCFFFANERTEARIAIPVLTLSQRNNVGITHSSCSNCRNLNLPHTTLQLVPRYLHKKQNHGGYTNILDHRSSTIYSARGCEHSSFRNRNPSKACQPATFAETDGTAAREKRARMRGGDARRCREELPIELEELSIPVEHERRNDRDPSATVSPVRWLERVERPARIDLAKFRSSLRASESLRWHAARLLVEPRTSQFLRRSHYGDFIWKIYKGRFKAMLDERNDFEELKRSTQDQWLLFPSVQWP